MSIEQTSARMSESQNGEIPKVSTLRWKILRQSLLSSKLQPHSDEKSQEIMDSVSRKGKKGFGLIQCTQKDYNFDEGFNHLCVSYSLPTPAAPNLLLFQRRDSCAIINDFEVCNKHDIDNTGLVCPWPSEEVLSYYCLSHADMFRCKNVIELGAGYGLAGLVIATVSEASEVVISDGNPQVVDYIQQSVAGNSGAFGATVVEPKLLHWNQEEFGTLSHKFDVIVASDCTFFKEVHKGLVQTLKSLLKDTCSSKAILFSPKRGDSLDKFLEEVQKSGLHFSVSEDYDDRVWERHQQFMKGDQSWPNYDPNHCYPLLIQISRL
ncbi:calmodulin-lysine N-methyltransferase [Silene latifolia]|uniref:calmodulin-lysine N-methyltransferase n=1 Tax=Silene latifolia TaxID=37657 RepID=UPI003D78999A